LKGPDAFFRLHAADWSAANSRGLDWQVGETMANALTIPANCRAQALGILALAALGLCIAGCGSAESGESAPPPVETRDLDASQSQRTLPPLD
jgi:hypothetical protein